VTIYVGRLASAFLASTLAVVLAHAIALVLLMVACHG
jgi:hypothetical protein